MTNFYPRPPRGGRPLNDVLYRYNWEFLSTPSARRATGYRSGVKHGKLISIHALREEGDNLGNGINHELCIFLSTPSARRATFHEDNMLFVVDISIHALREEGDRRPPTHQP